MKISFAIPDEIGCQFKKAVPAGQRSAVVTVCCRRSCLRLKRIWNAYAPGLNGLARLSREMAEWERFDDSEA